MPSRLREIKTSFHASPISYQEGRAAARRPEFFTLASDALKKTTRAQVGQPAMWRNFSMRLLSLKTTKVIKTKLPDVACLRRFFPWNGRDKFTHLSGPKLVEG